MPEICVIGLGYVGLPTACLFANAGLSVLGVDVDRTVVNALREGTTRLEEEGLVRLVVAACTSGRLRASTTPEPSDTFLICVPTPVTAEGNADLSAVTAAARSILPVLRRGNLVILESTSPVGTTRQVVGTILAESGLKPDDDFELCYCPERVLPGNTVQEMVNNARLVGGATPAAAERAQRLYQRVCAGPVILTDDGTAEMSKLMENTFRDVNIALANAFARMAEEAGIDVWRAIDHANRHPRVNIHRPGPGVGGHCIPVDPWFLIDAFPQHSALLRTARALNDGQPERLLGRLVATGRLQAGDKLAILGAAYKADSDDPRESPAATLAELAARQGFRIAVHDPLVKGDYHGLKITKDLPACLQGAAAAALVTEHGVYRKLPPALFTECMSGRLLADARNWLDHAAFQRAGFTVLVLGAPAKPPGASEADLLHRRRSG